jgi:hypothetical protein
MGQSPTVDTWEQALLTIRLLGHTGHVTVPKAAEPGLPDTVTLRLSNFPWSIHRGATRVYREDNPGEHVQIREYQSHWTVSLDRYNPHYRPLRHSRTDVPATALASVPIAGAIRSLLLAERMSSRAIELPCSVLKHDVQPLVNAVLPWR